MIKWTILIIPLLILTLSGCVNDTYVLKNNYTTNEYNTYNTYNNISNLTMQGSDRICFNESDVCIQNGTDTWLWLRDINDSTNRNLRVHGLYATTFLELAPNAKMIFGYTDIDKYIVYDSANDELDFTTDNVSFVFSGGPLESWGHQYGQDISQFYSVDGTLLYKFGETGSGHAYMEIRSGSNAMVHRFRGDTGDTIIGANGQDVCINAGSCDANLAVEGDGYIADHIFIDPNTYDTTNNWTGSDVLTGCLDNAKMTINEESGGDPLNITFTFTGVTDFNNVVVCSEYTGSHDIHMSIYNTVTGTWHTMNDIGLGDTINCNYKSVGGNDDSLINNTELYIRMDHPQNGVNSHDLIIDCLKLEK